MEEKLNDEIKYDFVLMREARHQHPREPLPWNRVHPFPAPGLAAQHPHPEPRDGSPLGPSGGVGRVPRERPHLYQQPHSQAAAWVRLAHVPPRAPAGGSGRSAEASIPSGRPLPGGQNMSCHRVSPLLPPPWLPA